MQRRGQFRSALGRAPGFHRQALLRIRCRQRLEVGATADRRDVDAIDRQHVDEHVAMTMVVAGACRYQVALAQPVLPDDMRRDPGVSGIGEVAVRRAAHEASVTRRVEPAYRLAVSDNRRRWQLRLVHATTATTAMTPVPASVAVLLVIPAFVPAAFVPATLVPTSLVPPTLVPVELLTAPVMVFRTMVRVTRRRRR
jgi:hypothetical protein